MMAENMEKDTVLTTEQEMLDAESEAAEMQPEALGKAEETEPSEALEAVEGVEADEADMESEVLEGTVAKKRRGPRLPRRRKPPASRWSACATSSSTTYCPAISTRSPR